MQLPFLKSKEKPKNFFLSLLIKPDKVGAILFEEINSKLFILATNEIDVGRDTSDLTGEELLSAADKVISFVEGKLPEGTEVEKTIFSAPYYWVSDGKIRQEYLEKLKNVCRDLGLVPVGYIVSIEAIVAFLQKKEGAPISGIFIEVTSDKMLLYVVRASKIIEEKQSQIQENIVQSAEKLLQEVESVDVLPSKIILLDYKDGSRVQQEFLSHQWSREIPFLHLPQVMLLERGFENEAIINGVATQMELEVLHDVSLRDRTVLGPAGVLREKEEPEGQLEQVDSKDFGFRKDGELETEKKAEDEEQVQKESGTKTEGTEDDEEEKEKRGPQLRSQLGKEDEPNISYFKEGDQEKDGVEEQSKELSSKIKIPNVSSVLSLFQNLRIPKIKGIPLAQNFSGPLKIKLILSLFGVILFALFVSFVYYNFILRAEIRIMADKKSVDKTQNIVFSKNQTSGTNINIELAEETASGEEKKNSTGKKETGDKAKGTVTIYSSLSREQTFSKGIAIKSVTTKHEYSFNENVKVASSSGLTDVKTVKAQVTASEIGKEFNLPSQTKFTVGTFDSSEVEAKNESAFTGGTKKETTVVSEEDLEELLSEITAKLEKEAVSAVRKKLPSDQDILSSALSSEVLERKYTKKEGEEAGSVGITAKIRYSIGKYKKIDVNSVVESLSRSDIPGTYVLKTSDSNVEITNVKIGKDRVSAVLKVNAVYIPQIESEKLAESLKGKSHSAASKQIKNIAGVTDVVITFKNNLPFMPLILPQNGKNILIEEEY